MRVSVSVMSVGHPDEVTRRVGVAPDRTLAAGEAAPESGIRSRFNHWWLDSGVDDEGAELDEHLNALAERLRGATARVGELADDEDVMISVENFVEDGEEPVRIELSAEALVFVAAIRASLNIEIYRM